jgi:hypothetical protein
MSSTITESISTHTADLTRRAEDAGATTWSRIEEFSKTHTTLLIVIALTLILIVACVIVLHYYPRAFKWKIVKNKVILPRDGKTSIKGLRNKKTGATTTTATDIKFKKTPKPQPPRPDPHPVSPNDKEVFNVSNNIYTYADAPAVCKALNARLAKPHEVEQAYKDGAEWCNYGWSEGQQALYPTQQSTVNKLKKYEEHAHDCGVAGVNGGYFENPDLQFGVNCYGKKPEPRIQEKDLIGYFPDYISEKDRRMQERVREIKKNLDNVIILPYNRNQWDERRTFLERVEDVVQKV